MRRIVLAAGGTGGHFYPGLACAQTLKNRGWEPLMVVRRNDPALKTLEAAGIPALPVDLHGLPRGIHFSGIRFAGKLFAATRLLSRGLKAFRPDLVLGMGGYLTFPLIWTAWRQGIPRAVHESNAVPGLANRASAKLGAHVFRGLPSSSSVLGTLVGTPVRPELRTRREPGESRQALGLDPKKTTLLVFGGSQGAQALNTRLPFALAGIPGIQILHLAGRGRAEQARAAYASSHLDADVREYLDDMASAYGAADLVICRAGASTLAELSALSKPALLVPYPGATDGHQDANARVLENAGAAARVPEGEFESKLRPALDELLGSKKKLLRMAAAYRTLGLPPPEKTTEIFIHHLEALIKK